MTDSESERPLREIQFSAPGASQPPQKGIDRRALRHSTGSTLPIDERHDKALKLLGDIWALTHRGGDYGADRFERFRRVLADAVDPSDFLSREVLEGLTATAHLADALDSMVFAGDPASIELQVDALVDSTSDPEQLYGLLRGPIAATLRRLYADGRGSRETHADILMRALSRLAGTPLAADVARRAIRYLWGQTDRGTGFYLTLTGLISIAADVDRSDPARFREYSVLYHLVLRSLWLAYREGQNQYLSGEDASLVITCASNLVIITAEEAQRVGQDLRDPHLSDTLQRLKRVTAAVTPSLRISASEAQKMVDALGLPSGASAIDTLTVLMDMAIVAVVWGADNVGLARIQASSAAIAALSGQVRQVPIRLYNAGVSLDRAARDTPNLLGQLLLNALGLRWSLTLAPTLEQALLASEGLECATNFMATALEYRDGGGQIQGVFGRLVAILGGLAEAARIPAWQEAGFARIAHVTERLGVAPQIEREPGSIIAVIDGVIEERLRPARPRVPLPAAPSIGVAVLVRELFEAPDRLARASWPIFEVLQDLVARRLTPVRTFITAYGKFAEPLDDPVGGGPTVPAAVMSPQEWREAAARVLAPLDSIDEVLAPLAE